MLYIFLLLTLTSCTLKDQRVRNEVAERMVVNDIAYVIDSTNSWKIEDVVASKNDFKPYTEPELNFGHLRDALWVRVSLENLTSDSQEIYLSSDQFILEDVQFFYQKDSAWQKESSGWGRPVLARQLPTYLHAFTFSLAPKEKTSVYYRVKNEYQMLRLPLTLYNKQGFYSHHNKSLLMDGLVIMALLTSILFSLYNLIFTAKYRGTMVLYFIYALNFLVFYTLRVASPAFISTAYPIELNYFINIFIFISTYTFVRFAISFVNDKNIPENKYITGLINVSFGATLLVSLFPSQEANPFFFAIKLSFFVGSILYLIWYLLTHIKDNVLARIYIVMAMPLILSGMVEGLTNVFGVLKIPNQFFEAFRMSICLEMLFILFALIYREQYLGKIIQNQLKATEFKLLNTQIEIQEAEQERIAKDLHDDLGGTLSTLKRFIFDKLISKATENEKSIIKKLTQKAGDDLRRISHALLPPEINIIGLTATLKELVSRNDGERSFKFIQHGKIKKLDENTEINIYRIVSEIIQNINKHSSANKVLIQMLWSDEELTIMVEDNGSQFRNTKEGLGLKNIRMRTEYINGMINFDSNDTESTIILEIPIKNEKQDTHS